MKIKLWFRTHEDVTKGREIVWEDRFVVKSRIAPILSGPLISIDIASQNINHPNEITASYCNFRWYWSSENRFLNHHAPCALNIWFKKGASGQSNKNIGAELFCHHYNQDTLTPSNNNGSQILSWGKSQWEKTHLVVKDLMSTKSTTGIS